MGQQPRLSPNERREFAENVLAVSPDLAMVADQRLEMYGESGTVTEGLIRCADYMLQMTPVEITDMVYLKLSQQT